MRGLVNRWRVFWKDFNCVEHWRFPELSPVQLQQSLDIHCIDRGEYARVEWMWSRKPKLILGEGGLGYAILIFVALLLLLIPQVGVFLTTAWCITMLGAIARDVVRSIRWRRDYEVSITRIMRGQQHLR